MLDETIHRRFPSLARRAAKWHLKPTTYEGGLCWEGGPIEMIRLGRANRRAGYRYDQYLKAWQDVCGPDAIYQEYAMFSNYEGDAWPWMAIQYCSEGLKGTPSYDGMVRNSHPAGDVDLDGKVTYADFKILAANFGGDGIKDRRWWSQGDFNNDQVVGLDDLKLLLMNTNLAAWTAAQRQELDAFLAAHPGPYVLGPDPQDPPGDLESSDLEEPREGDQYSRRRGFRRNTFRLCARDAAPSRQRRRLDLSHRPLRAEQGLPGDR
ncbi:MAG: hypothetical protein ABSG68_18390 [Thermoguttaceae bacterium]|jgi:hypothetical protein